MARAFHLLTAVVAGAALLLQLGLVIDGASVLVVEDPPGLWLRLGRLVSYFTIQSNILVFLAALLLAIDPIANGGRFRVVRAAGLVGITITGLVYFFLLRPLLSLSGWSAVADNLLHIAVPVLAVVGWVAFGPRDRIDFGAVWRAFIWPVLWLAWTLVIGAATGWFPYPFLDWNEKPVGEVVVVCTAIFGLAAGLFWLALWVDRKLTPEASRAPTLGS